MTPGQRSSLVASIAGLEILFTVAESAAVLGPLSYLLPTTLPQGNWYMWLAVALLLWMAAMGLWLSPLLGVGKKSDTQIFQATARVPGRALVLRQLMWAGLGLLLALQLVDAGVITQGQAVPLLNVCLLHSLVVGLVRWGVQGRLLRKAMDHQNLLPAWRQLQVETLRTRLVEISVLLAVGGGCFAGLFSFLLVPLSLEQYLLVETYFPWTLVLLALGWRLVVLPRQVQPLMRCLDRQEEDREPSPEVVLTACRSAHRMPQKLALTMIALFGLAALLLLVQCLTVLEINLSKAVMVVVAMLIIAMGIGIYEMIWSRVELRPVVAHLLALPGSEDMEVRAGSLRRKMLLSFGGVVIFTVALALLWTTLHRQNLRRDVAAQRAHVALAPVMERLRLAPPTRVPALLPTLPRPPGSRLLWVPHQGTPPPMLSSTRVAEVRRKQRGVLDLDRQGLVGHYQRLRAGDARGGSVVLLVPLTADPREPLDLAGLVLFFLTTLALALGVVFLTSAELTRPLGALERRAAEMTQGYLTREVSHQGEFDTSGRLSSAFEQMRQTLVRKLRTIEKLNEELEQKVRLRTAELEQTNQDLVEAIEALKQAQQRLVMSEKLASVGQLVAGIAHEINNPINAVVNTVAPLSQTVEELSRAEAGSEQMEEHRQDLEQMLKVIRSGIQRTRRIVSALRNYSRTDAESRGAMDLHADIDETLALLQHNLKGVEVTRRFEAGGQLTAFRGQLNQALMNLLANAAAALEGQDDSAIIVGTRDVDDDVEITVEDNGPGIPAEVRSRIFDPFFTTKEVGKGTGLGLSITHGIAERHGGTITVDSEPGRTIFTLQIPRA